MKVFRFGNFVESEFFFDTGFVTTATDYFEIYAQQFG